MSPVPNARNRLSCRVSIFLYLYIDVQVANNHMINMHGHTAVANIMGIMLSEDVPKAI